MCRKDTLSITPSPTLTPTGTDVQRHTHAYLDCLHMANASVCACLEGSPTLTKWPSLSYNRSILPPNRLIIEWCITCTGLAQNRYFEDPAFVKYLEYLCYWKDPQYAKYLQWVFVMAPKQGYLPNWHHNLQAQTLEASAD